MKLKALFWNNVSFKKPATNRKDCFQTPKNRQKQPFVWPTYLNNHECGPICLKYFLNIAIFPKKKSEAYMLNSTERDPVLFGPEQSDLHGKRTQFLTTPTAHTLFTDKNNSRQGSGGWLLDILFPFTPKELWQLLKLIVAFNSWTRNHRPS